MRFLFRVDAAREIGSGHVMRCLCLAEALAAAGHESRFLSRRREGDLIGAIEARGFGCAELPAIGDRALARSWLGAAAEVEVAEARAAVAAEAPDWLVLDHYALDAGWTRAVVPQGVRVLVIDDLADRPQAGDMLLDQGLANTPADYVPLTPTGMRLLLGPAYALLRPEFADLRPAAEARDRSWPPGRVLVNLGGIDPDNATGAVLEALARSDLPDACRIDVVMGQNAPHVAVVREMAAASRLDVRVAVDVTDMGARMLAADLAIGAAGTTSWERACLGLPSLMLSIAENQLGVAEALGRAGAAVDLGPLWQPGWRERLAAGLTALAEPGRLAQMSAACLGLVDGAGTARVVQALVAPVLTLRRCTMNDAEPVWRWREADGAARFYRSGQPTPWEVHERWFRAALDDPDRALFMVEQKGVPVAHLRFDLPDTGLPEVGLAVDPARKGAGLGLGTVALAVRHARTEGWPGLAADVHNDNAASARVFTRNGFRPGGRRGAFMQYQIDLSEGAPS